MEKGFGIFIDNGMGDAAHAWERSVTAAERKCSHPARIVDSRSHILKVRDGPGGFRTATVPPAMVTRSVREKHSQGARIDEGHSHEFESIGPP